jgi:ubiquinone/menaquinone biosynthesis C-methylase UbiE
MSWEDAVSWLRSQPEQAALVEACYYDDPIEKAASRFATSDEFQEVLAIAKLKPQSKILDFGAGRGIASFGFACQSHHVTALEPDPSELVGRGCIQQLCQRTGIDIQLSADTAETISSPENTFDLAYCRAALHHARSLQGVCQEVFRVLKPGGLLIATREHVISQEADLPKFLNSHPLHHLYGGEMAYLLKNYLTELKAAGFQQISVLQPRQSIINAFPRHEENLANEARAYLVNRLGRPGAWVSRWTAARKAALGRLDRRDHTPGRLYSFVAVKPR